MRNEAVVLQPVNKMLPVWATMTLLDGLGIDPENMSWRDFAACKNVARRYVDDGGNEQLYDPVFNSYEADSPPYPVRKAMDAMCMACPVAPQCYSFGVDNKESGVYGGFYLTLGVIDKARNAHKSKATETSLKNRGDG